MHQVVIGLSASAVLIALTSQLSGQKPARPSVEEVLARWERAGSALTTVDVTFEWIDRAPFLVAPRRWRGRLVLKRPHLALVEFREGADAPMVQTLAWGDTEFHQLLYATKQVFVHPRREPDAPTPHDGGPLAALFVVEHRGRSHHLPSLPYLFGIDADELRRRYEVELVGERSNGFVVSLKPRKDGPRFGEFSRCLVLLDHRDFRPTAMRWEIGSSTTRTFLLRDARYNEPVEDAIFEPRSVPEGWKVFRYDEPTATGRIRSGRP